MGNPCPSQGNSGRPPTLKEGWRIELCPGGPNCPNAVIDPSTLIKHLEGLFKSIAFTDYVRERSGGTILYHNQFSVSISCCPNACSQPQIKDVGIVGGALVGLRDELCDGCSLCVEVCQEGALSVDGTVEMDRGLCVGCSACAKTCPAGALAVEKRGYNLMFGGKLGRHPRLATPLLGLLSGDEVLSVISKCLNFYMDEAKRKERLGDLLERVGWDRFYMAVTI